MGHELIKGSEAVLLVGKKLYPDKDFNLEDPERKEMYRDMFNYFMGREGRFNLKKGICFTGHLGVGKSSAFKVYQQIFHRYKIVDAEQIELDLKSLGEVDTLEKYGYNYQHDLLIDDIGSESKEVHIYKNSVSIIGLILKQRYRLFIDYGFKTHATSNLDNSQLKLFYNEQNYDRFKESMNLTPWYSKISLRK